VAPDGLIFGLPVEGVLALGAALLVLLPSILAYVVAQNFGPQARLKARLAAIGGTRTKVFADDTKASSAARRTRQIEQRLKETGHAGARRRRVELRLRLERAGLTMSLRKFYAISTASALAGSALYLLMGYPPLFVLAVAPVMGVGLPRYALRFLTRRRQKQFTKLFADALDVIVRGIRSGLPVGECLNIIARESPDPVGAEFKLIVESQRLGMTLKQALERACRRMPTADMKFFAVVLNLQQHTGGNLAETLAGLSNVLRGRKKMADKVKAMSSEARMTASIIGALPFLVALVIYVMNTDYIMLLWTEPLGNVILYGGVTWMVIGIFIMKQMITFEI